MLTNKRNICDASGMRLWGLLCLLSVALNIAAQDNKHAESGTDYNLIELKVDTMPRLNTARMGHILLNLDGELTVFGGHTNGFMPTATAEYFSDGAWHSVPLTYSHDHGTALRLRSGKVLLAGGHKEELGIGQQFSAELYDPKTHSVRGIGCMDSKRAFANAVELADGQVLIAGNWYADDGIEMFEDIYDPRCTNAVGVKEVSVPRAKPYILRIADDDAIIFGSVNNKNNPIDKGIIDRLKGDSYHEAFLDKWQPLSTTVDMQRSYNYFAGDESKGLYEWLLPVENKQTEQVAIALVKGLTEGSGIPSFSLLRTVPDTIQGKRITYSSLLCNRKLKTAYLIGDDDKARIYVVAIPFDGGGVAPLTVYVTDPQPIAAQSTTPVLTDDGDIVFAGGTLYSNFSPTDSVFMLPISGRKNVATADNATAQTKSSNYLWLYLVIALVLCGIVAAIIVVVRIRRKRSTQKVLVPDTERSLEGKSMPKEEAFVDLFKRIEQLMEEEQLYLNANLRASDVATRVGSNTAYVSAAINTQRGCSFSQFLTAYRIAYAQNLMRQNPESKISTISTLSGFSTDSTFFRAFRASTGLSPKEWLSAIREEQ